MAKKQAKTNVKSKDGLAQLGEMAVLSPDAVTWEIGDRVFYQQPLNLKRLSNVMKEVVDVLLSGGRGALLDKVVDTLSGEGELEGKTRQAMMPVLIRTVVSVPESLPRICALIVEKGDEKFFNIHLRGRQALAIVKTFIEQNEVGALLQDFFGLMGSLQTSLETATAELKEEATDDSPSGSPKTEEASEPQ